MALEIHSAFKAAGVSDEHARAAVESINKAIDERYALHSWQLAAQGGIEKTQTEIEKVRIEIEKVRTEIGKVEVNLIKWNVGALIAATGLAMAVARVFLAA
ncbi:MAG: hypothetical protein LBI59_02075 [Candidatus Accumulibacter sp.]|jgi:hypothetical protein|nr:hypothetical protein [Accumulibacter sp.]